MCILLLSRREKEGTVFPESGKPWNISSILIDFFGKGATMMNVVARSLQRLSVWGLAVFKSDAFAEHPVGVMVSVQFSVRVDFDPLAGSTPNL
jgi:translation elongation factor P/translation initiation factor 5A